MKKHFWKKLSFSLVPDLILAIISLLISNTFNYICSVKHANNVTYTIVYYTNKCSCPKEIDLLISGGFLGIEYSASYPSFIKTYAEINDEKYAIVSSLQDGDDENQSYVSAQLKNPNKENIFINL